MQTSAFCSRITSLYRSQASPVVLCMQNSMICTRMTGLYGLQPLSVFISSCKTVTFGPVLQVCMGPSPHVWFCACKSATLALELQGSVVCFCMQIFDFWTRITSLYGSQTWPVILWMYNSVLNIRITSLYGSQPSSVVFAFKTSWLASELLVSMGPRSHDWFLDAKQRRVGRNSRSMVPALICGFCMQNSDFWNRITNLYGSQTSPVVLWIQYSMISTRITFLYGSHPLSLVFACKTAPFGTELQVCMGPWPHLSFCACKTTWLASKLLVFRDPSPSLWFLDAKQRLLDQNDESPWVPDLNLSFCACKSAWLAPE